MHSIMETHALAVWGLFSLALLVLVQSMVAAAAHRRQSSYVPGVVADTLGHGSFVFRSHRTFLNSLENLPMMAFPSLLALLVGMDAGWLGGLVWTYVGARVMHMVLYYAIATEKNPSPRSYFYSVALLANLALFVKLGLHML